MSTQFEILHLQKVKESRRTKKGILMFYGSSNAHAQSTDLYHGSYLYLMHFTVSEPFIFTDLGYRHALLTWTFLPHENIPI